MTHPRTPLLSVIVIGYRMARQLANTLFTLGPAYQRNVAGLDYEVIVVENESDDCMDQRQIDALPANFRYHRRVEPGRSPVAAINVAFGHCRGEYIGLIVDGARLLSPRILEYAALAYRMDPDSIVTVPGYHLGDQQQHEITDPVEAYAREKCLLESIDWRGNGYLLFTVSTLGGGNSRGYLQPFMESNCFFAAARHFARIGHADTRFQYSGGGSVNLHTFRALGLHPQTRFVVLPGEGSFHQYHGGVTTRAREDREQEISGHNAQLREIWQENFHGLRREPLLLGAVTPWALPFLTLSSEMGQGRARRLEHMHQPLWRDDEDLRNGRHFNPCDATQQHVSENDSK